MYNVYPSQQGEIVSGRVTNTNGNPIGGAMVTAQTPMAAYTSATDNNGIYAMIVPANTTFVVAVSNNRKGYGFVPRTQTPTTGVSSDTGNEDSGNVWGVNFQERRIDVAPIINLLM